jgi:hypothetical protein
MTHHDIGITLALILGSAATFVVGWYLLGIGIGIALRGFNRAAPCRIRRIEERPQLTSERPEPTYKWPTRV